MSRFSSTQVTLMVLAGCAAVVLAPIGVLAATGTAVNITDGTTAAYKAHVGSKGGLYANLADPVTNNQARVTSGRLLAQANVQEAPGEPVVYENSGLASVNEQYATAGVTVPAGRRFVIESINARSTELSGQQPLLYVTLTTNGFVHSFPLQFTSGQAGESYQTVSQLVRWYADGGSAVTFVVSREGGSMSGSIYFSFAVTGYLL